MGAIFGKNKNKTQQTSQNTSEQVSSNASQQESEQQSNSLSENQAYGDLKDAYGGIMGQAGSGADALSALLSGDPSGFNAFKQATGFDAQLGQGMQGITGGGAASGLLRSGGTGKALQSFGNNLQNQFSGNYMDRLLQKANLGFQAGNLISGAGNRSVSSSSGRSTGSSIGSSRGSSTGTSAGSGSGSSKPGIGGLLGGAASLVAASDVRLKKNIFKVGKLMNGLNVYQFRYINGNGPYIGVMAQEVAAVMPHALGPVIGGYMTVNYAALGGLL